MNIKSIKNEIDAKKEELSKLVTLKGNLLDKDVYKKSCELDKLVVKYMKTSLTGSLAPQKLPLLQVGDKQC